MDKDNVSKIEFEQVNGDFKVQKVALYNRTKLSEKSAVALIKSGLHSDDLVIMDKVQFDSIFFGK